MTRDFSWALAKGSPFSCEKQVVENGIGAMD